MGTTSKRGYYYPDGNDEVSLFPDQHRVLAMKKIDTDMNTALTETRALEFRVVELESGPRVTGPRNINSLITNGGDISGELGLIRCGNTVTIYATSLKMDGSGSSKLIILPDGFRPPVTMQAEWCGRGSKTEYFDIYSSGSIWAGRLGKDKDHNGVITYVTTDSWPSTLPGDPA